MCSFAQYLSPTQNPQYYSEEIFPTLEEETCHFQAQGNVLICGDTNTSTGTLPDLTSTRGDSFITGHTVSNCLNLLHRNNSDSTVNKNRRDLLQLCRSLGLYFVNGSLQGYSLGRVTYLLLTSWPQHSRLYDYRH